MYMYIGGSWGKGRPTKKTVRLVSLRIKVTVQGILRYRFAKIPSYPLLRTAPPLSSSSRISRSVSSANVQISNVPSPEPF